ncbi:MAG TPA: glycoside hydrolase family 3 C-terminal domain-containing protein [Methanocella sp.]|nr:glycoside hydrolase family 3 C-terminal domain-containing protein [Methanocella sp.]
MIVDTKNLVADMTLEEKASLCSGQDTFRLKGIPRLGIPSILLSDGPHGLRKQATAEDGLIEEGRCLPATCFPAASTTASSWDRNLMFEIGKALAEECLHEEVAVLLGPGINIKRSPLCGRNFEYLSEDPYLAGELASSLIDGMQTMGVGASLKHFAVNNQEHRRMTINAVVDERTLREIYLSGFERAVKTARPWTVMCSYNQVNGTFASEHGHLLDEILRGEWGYEGAVISDWGACDDRVEGLRAGLDLEMPSSHGLNDVRIVKAVREGKLDEAVLDRTTQRLLDLIFKAVENRKSDYFYDRTSHHVIARQAASESMVLLKNNGHVLPLKRGVRLAVIGAFAIHPRFRGGGSSQVYPCHLEKAYSELAAYTPSITYAEGYGLATDEPDEALIQRACSVALGADVAIVFAGLPDRYESEGLDREHLRLPTSHDELIRRVTAANSNTVIVLSGGAPVEMPWINDVKAVLEGYLGGQAAGGATADVLFGMVNPSGKLAETFACSLEDYPSTKYFPGGSKTVEYREGIYVGYRYFDRAKKNVLFPFGHGLSYTTFEYSNMEISRTRILDNEEVMVSITVKNAGDTAGAEVAQLYVRDVESTIFRPEKELKGFDKVFLQPGEEMRLGFTLDRRSFAYYNVEIADWHVESGAFEILIGSSSADIRARKTVWVESTEPCVPVPDLRHELQTYYDIPNRDFTVDDRSFWALYGRELPPDTMMPGELYTVNSTLSDLKQSLIGKIFYDMIRNNVQSIAPTDENGEPQSIITGKMIDDMPLRSLPIFSNGLITEKVVEALILIMNRKTIRGYVQLSTALLKIG